MQVGEDIADIEQMMCAIPSVACQDEATVFLSNADELPVVCKFGMLSRCTRYLLEYDQDLVMIHLARAMLGVLVEWVHPSTIEAEQFEVEYWSIVRG